MNTSLKVTALSLSIALPCSFLLELAGATLPAAFDTFHVLTAFVVTLVFLTLFSEYGRTLPQLAPASTPERALQPCVASHQAEHPLAA